MGVFARRSAPHSLSDGARKTISTRKLAPSHIWVKTMAWNCLAPGPETHTRKTQTAEPEVPKCREHPTHKDRPHRPGHPQACGKECEGHDCRCELIKRWQGRQGRGQSEACWRNKKVLRIAICQGANGIRITITCGPKSHPRRTKHSQPMLQNPSIKQEVLLLLIRPATGKHTAKGLQRTCPNIMIEVGSAAPLPIPRIPGRNHQGRRPQRRRYWSPLCVQTLPPKLGTL